MRSTTCNSAQEREKEKVCFDMNGYGSHVTVANIISYDIFVCFYIDMSGCGRKKKGQAMQSHRVNEFPMSGQSVLLHYYLYQWE